MVDGEQRLNTSSSLDNIHPRLAVRIYNAFRAGRVDVRLGAAEQRWPSSPSPFLPTQEARQGQEAMNRIIALLIQRCRCAERGTNIVAGIKCIYERKYGIHAGVTKPGASIVLTEVRGEVGGAGRMNVTFTLFCRRRRPA